jgi:hypothetical protein
MDVEETAKGPNAANPRLRWRTVLERVLFFSSLMMAWFALWDLHLAGKPIWPTVLTGIVSGAIYAALMYLFPPKGAW